MDGTGAGRPGRGARTLAQAPIRRRRPSGRLAAVDDHRVPTVNAASSEQSQSTAAAISSGRPMRPTGSCAITAARPSSVSPVKRRIIPVSTMPGQIASMRIPSAAQSSAADRVSPIRPCFVAAFAAWPRRPRTPATDAVSTIAPPPPRRVRPISCFIDTNTARRFTANSRSHSASAISCSGLTPAATRAIRARPHSSRRCSSATGVPCRVEHARRPGPGGGAPPLPPPHRRAARPRLRGRDAARRPRPHPPPRDRRAGLADGGGAAAAGRLSPPPGARATGACRTRAAFNVTGARSPELVAARRRRERRGLGARGVRRLPGGRRVRR